MTTTEIGIDTEPENTWISSNESIKHWAFKDLKRNLSEDELGSSWVQKILLDKIDKLEFQVSSLEFFKEQYHIKDKECDVFKEKMKVSNAFETLYGFCLAGWALIIWLVPSFWDPSKLYSWISVLIWFLLFIWWLLIKLSKKWA